MFLDSPAGRSVALCYSMNVHPGEGMDDVLAALERYVLPLRERLGVSGPFAVGLRIAARAAEETERFSELRAFLDAHSLVAVTVNAFPFGDFHGARVKEEVYAPDWTSDERVRYTLAVAELLAGLREPGSDVSMSTVPLSFKPWSPDLGAATTRLLEVAEALRKIELRTRVRVRVALEPEPFCTLETAAEMEAYWTGVLAAAASDTRLLEYLGVCPDTCHHAVRWESGADALDRYFAAGIPVPKVQLSSALEADRLSDLEPFAEPRYLHQVVARDGGDMLDLGMDGSALSGPLRCHFHVPVHKDCVGACRTTRGEMDLALDRALSLGATGCLEIETYTWDVLPLREGELLDSLEAEYRYVLSRINR
ncbi:MAG: metabolite traffic protein EboE [Planctomycetota bacterium]